jgi:hypothetical protein
VTFVRNLVTDLVEKRLWPIALALVVAIVAVPVALGGGNAQDRAPAPNAIAAPAGARAAADPADPAIAVSDPVPADRRRSGRVRNPFEQIRGGDDSSSGGTSAAAGSSSPAVGAPAAGGSVPGAETITGGTGGVAPAPGTGTGTGSNGSGTGSGGADHPDADSMDVYRVDLRFGRPGGLKVLRDVARLTPLPSADNPFFVFLGLLDDGETLVFLISSDVAATGDGKCRPSSKSCQTIELQAGDTEFFDFTQEDGSVVQYQMDVLGVDRRDATSAKTAAASRARKSQVGQELLRMAAADDDADAFDAYRFRPDRGVLVRAKRRARARGAMVGGETSPIVSRWALGTRPRTVTRKGEVAAWRTRPRATR